MSLPRLIAPWKKHEVPAVEIPKITSWSDLRSLFESGKLRSWAFRGQPDAAWGLKSSLTRYFEKSGIDDRDTRRKQEERILRIFRRKAHLHLGKVPDERDAFEWLALMQHHGAPTRLLDFTWSPYVAAFYALAPPPQAAEAAIFAIYTPGLSHERYGPWKFGNYRTYFLPNKHNIVVYGEPHHMNRRLIAHSGTFVIPGRIDMDVGELIRSQIHPQALVKITFPVAELRREAIAALYSMNITYATLFPDLDGLARSMGFELELHWQFDPVTGAPYLPPSD
jgi:hypothetical protein